ncbi:hypothetical protein V5O48_015759 [Marasmius crinis-equi]|uniref:GATA-type domain-containing protein n=1 Tax=Marasmius crinis-equi TaxID=585013 RepID=A0ABR3EU07_9AGAR
MPVPDVLGDPRHTYPRHASSTSYPQTPNANLAGAWNYNDFSSCNPPYTPYSSKSPHSQHSPVEAIDNFVWSPEYASGASHSHSVLEESYARGYPSYNNDSVPQRYQTADSHGYHPNQRVLYTGHLNPPQLPKISSGSWTHPPSPMALPHRSHSDPSESSRWVSVSQRAGRSIDSPHWSDIMLPSIEQYESKQGVRDSLEDYSPLSAISSLSPSPSPEHIPRASTENVPGQEGTEAKPAPKMCSHCRATSTPLWRREPGTLKPLCNACGLYLQQRNKLRPQELIDADIDDESSDVSGDGAGPECSHCHTHNTSVWRRSKTGEQLCNACGVYSRLRGRDRPLSLKRNKIKPRTKHAPAK